MTRNLLLSSKPKFPGGREAFDRPVVLFYRPCNSSWRTFDLGSTFYLLCYFCWRECLFLFIFQIFFPLGFIFRQFYFERTLGFCLLLTSTGCSVFFGKLGILVMGKQRILLAFSPPVLSVVWPGALSQRSKEKTQRAEVWRNIKFWHEIERSETTNSGIKLRGLRH